MGTAMVTGIEGLTVMEGSMAMATAMNSMAIFWLNCNGGLNGNWDGDELNGDEGIDSNCNRNGGLNGDSNGDGDRRLNCDGGLNGIFDGKEINNMEGIDSNDNGDGG